MPEEEEEEEEEERLEDQRHCVRRPFKGVHQLCQLGAALWELFVCQFCSIPLPSLPCVSWWLVCVSFVPHQAQSTIYYRDTCLDGCNARGDHRPWEPDYS